MTKKEIEEFLSNKGDFVKIDHLTRFLKEKPPLDKRKFILEILSDIYESKRMYTESAKIHNNLAIASIALSQKRAHYIKEAELYIKAGRFGEVDEAIKKAISEANSREREEVHIIVKQMYHTQAEIYEKEGRSNHALKIYEKLLEMNITDFEREAIKNRLMPLYEKLGKLKQYFALKKE